MFKSGDSIVCIDSDSFVGKITHGKKYELLHILNTDEGNIYLINRDDGRPAWFNENKFISLSEYRGLKLKKICSRLVI